MAGASLAGWNFPNAHSAKRDSGCDGSTAGGGASCAAPAVFVLSLCWIRCVNRAVRRPVAPMEAAGAHTTRSRPLGRQPSGDSGSAGSSGTARPGVVADPPRLRRVGYTKSGKRIGDFLRERPGEPRPCTDVWRDRRIYSARPGRPPPCKEPGSRYRSRDPSVGATASRAGKSCAAPPSGSRHNAGSFPGSGIRADGACRESSGAGGGAILRRLFSSAPIVRMVRRRQNLRTANHCTESDIKC